MNDYRKYISGRAAMRDRGRIWRWIFPAHCALCDTLLKRTETGICTACRQRVRISCHLFPGGAAPFLYRGVYRESVKRFKYSGRAEYAGFFAEALLHAFFGMIREEGTAWMPDVLVPVPVHPNRFRERGYNQAEEAAKELGRRMQVPCAAGLVLRCRDTKPQSGLDPEGRRRNIRGAFRIKPGKYVPARILLVDDIRTTGSTLAEMEKLLMQRGAKEVRALCICMAVEDVL